MKHPRTANSLSDFLKNKSAVFRLKIRHFKCIEINAELIGHFFINRESEYEENNSQSQEQEQ